MKKYIFLFFILIGIAGCEKPEEGMEAVPSVNAKIVRFRIYQSQNIYFDGTINQEDGFINITIPSGIDRTGIYPEILISSGAEMTPKSGEKQNFTSPVIYKVVSEDGVHTQTYEVIVNY